MSDIEIFQQSTWNPLSLFNLDYPWLYVNVQTVINTWIVLSIICISSLILRYIILQTDGPIRFYILQSISSFMKLTSQSLGSFYYSHFSFIFSLFVFILLCNWLSILPWTSEPTQDINTTLGLGLLAFFYKEIYAIRIHGLYAYLAEFMQPFFVMFPVNVIGHFSKIISLSFRLFGNIFGGSIIMELYTSLLQYSFIAEILGLLSGFNFLILLAFGIFEGLIQAFVFTMLSMTYLALAIQTEEPGE